MRVVVRCWPLPRAAQLRLAAAAAVAADGGGAADVVLLQHPADQQRRTLCRPPLCLQRLPVRPQLLWTHMYPRLTDSSVTAEHDRSPRHTTQIHKGAVRNFGEEIQTLNCIIYSINDANTSCVPSVNKPAALRGK